MSRIELAARLKKYRESAGLTIYEVGQRIGKSGKTVSAWECGRGQPDADMLLTLCDVYGIESIADLFSDDASSPLVFDEQSLLDAFRSMNDEGKAAALAAVRGLAASGLYQIG